MASDKTPPVTNLGDSQDISHLLAAAGGRQRHSLSGFDPDYVDFVDYIIRSTYKIWENKGIGLIYDHYRHNAIIHTSDGMTYGRDKVIADSLKTMAAFPDIRLYADDVIWSGNDAEGFHSSHRIMWVGQNTGHSIYGPPTGRRVVRQGIAHCYVKENRVVEEWICRDELALIRQLGFDEHALARRIVEQEVTAGLKLPSLNKGEIQRVEGQNTPSPVPEPTQDGFDPDYFVRRAFHEIWNWRLLNVIDAYMVPNYGCRVSTNRTLYGLGAYKAYILAWMAAFSDVTLLVDHVCWVTDAPDKHRVATRWTLQGTHDGPGIYGAPTGKRIQLIGISHHEIVAGRFVREWTVFDEFALLKQLYRPD